MSAPAHPVDEHLLPGEHYVRFSIDNPRGYGNRSGAYKTAVELEFLDRHLPPPPARVLDIAGGSGRIALPLAQRGYAVTVSERHAPSIRLLERRGRELGVHIVPSEFFSTEFEGVFDCVLAVECLDLMPFDRVVERASTLLKSGGTFAFTLLNASSWRYAAHKFLGRQQKNEYFLPLSTYRHLWTGAGFELIAMRGYMWMPLTGLTDSRLVPLFAAIERRLRLHALHTQSPWLMVALRRR